MKTLLYLLFLASLALAQRTVISGQAGVASYVWWGTATDSTLKELWLVDKHYHDSAGTWVRDDNRADSCSRPFKIATDMGTYPVWLYELETRTRALDPDSNARAYYIETRFIKNSTKKDYWGWRRRGMVRGSLNMNYQDSISIPTTLSTSKRTVAAQFAVTGDEARLCPDEIASTANAAGDSIKSDTGIVRRQ
ncbi:MAG: hypothetical protein ABIY63_13325 [Fibrobacteria bacterium]